MIGQVFEAEKQVTKTGVIHKYCLACNDCNCNLDASSFFNGGDGEVSYDIKFIILASINKESDNGNTKSTINHILSKGLLQALLRSQVWTSPKVWL